jgi:hypothetical protein
MNCKILTPHAISKKYVFLIDKTRVNAWVYFLGRAFVMLLNIVASHTCTANLYAAICIAGYCKKIIDFYNGYVAMSFFSPSGVGVCFVFCRRFHRRLFIVKPSGLAADSFNFRVWYYIAIRECSYRFNPEGMILI